MAIYFHLDIQPHSVYRVNFIIWNFVGVTDTNHEAHAMIVNDRAEIHTRHLQNVRYEQSDKTADRSFVRIYPECKICRIFNDSAPNVRLIYPQ